jgi:glycosyltransferase involved in cell wall biosynthesis
MFSPRGGSAQVARAIAGELPAHGWDVTLVSGSGSGLSDADSFFEGLDVRAVDFERGDAPMHPSYEDRADAPDRCFALIDDDEYEEHVAAWSRAFDDAGAADADVLQLNHLTPMNEAAARIAPGVPVVGHLHGTELLMLERIADGPPASWVHAQAWAARMRRWAQACDQLIVLTPSHAARAAGLLGIKAEDCAIVPNGFDPERFRPGLVDRAEFWHHELVDEPLAWAPGEQAGSIGYEDVAVLDDAVVLLAVGRYTEVKRLGLLIRAFVDAKQRARRKIALVLVGGHPGEWEDEHPADVIRDTGATDVFLAGWHDHRELPQFLNAADVHVLASVREQFGLVLVEGMACGLPPIAVDRFGPAEIVQHGKTGWLVEPDDQAALADAMILAADDVEERARRGIAARREATRRWSWPALAGDVAAVLTDASSPQRISHAYGAGV